MELQYQQLRFHPESSAELRELLLAKRIADREAAFWLHENGEGVLCLLTSGEHACLCHQPTLSWSRGKDCDEDETMNFRLENGQMDEIALECVIGVEVAIAVFVEFFETGELSERIQWR